MGLWLRDKGASLGRLLTPCGSTLVHPRERGRNLDLHCARPGDLRLRGRTR